MENTELTNKIKEFIDYDEIDISTGNGAIKSINGYTIYDIDLIPTIFYNVKGNIAKGAIIRNNTEIINCWIIKDQGYYAHGETLHEAFDSLKAKILNNKPVEERIAEFKNHFNANDKYPAEEFIKWHHILTMSCKFGRYEFCKHLGIDIENDEFTVKEFIDLTENSFGGDIIKQLKTLF